MCWKAAVLCRADDRHALTTQIFEDSVSHTRAASSRPVSRPEKYSKSGTSPWLPLTVVVVHTP